MPKRLSKTFQSGLGASAAVWYKAALRAAETMLGEERGRS
jgi:hypothetical protein